MANATALLQVPAGVSRDVKKRDRRIQTGVSLVLPMYNEAESVDYTLGGALAQLAETFADFEIIVADDGSTDDCAARVQRWADRDSRVLLVRNARNQRFGGALRLGLACASKDVVIYTDFDLPVALEFLPDVLKELESADLVTGYSAEQSKNLGWGSRLLSIGYNLLVHTFFRLPLRDVNFGFKAMRRSLCKRLCLVSQSPFVDAEMFIQTRHMGYSVREVPVPFARRKHGVSRIRRADVIAMTLLDMLVCGAAAFFLPRSHRPAKERIHSHGLAAAFLAVILLAVAANWLGISVFGTAAVLLLSVLGAARILGLTSGLLTSAWAALLLAVTTPPAWSISISRPFDRLIVVIFLLSAAGGSTLVGTRKTDS